MSQFAHAFSTVIEICATMSTAAYSANDQVGGVQTLLNASRANSLGTVIQSVTVIDIDKQNAELDLYFFDANPTVSSTDNAALAIDDSQVTDKCIGVVNISSGDYKSIAGCSVATAKNVGLLVTPIEASEDVYVVVATRGTPTYATGGAGLIFKYHLLRD
jgi:hypothetical protein